MGAPVRGRALTTGGEIARLLGVLADSIGFALPTLHDPRDSDDRRRGSPFKPGRAPLGGGNDGEVGAGTAGGVNAL